MDSSGGKLPLEEGEEGGEKPLVAGQVRVIVPG